MRTDEVEVIKRASNRLACFLYTGLQQKLEPIRLARASYALIFSGCSPKATFPGLNIGTYLTETQKSDGGWADVEETLWCLGYLAAFGEKYQKEICRGHKWLVSVQLPSGAWGKSNRDQPRIPATALAIVLAPEIIDNTALDWLTQQWESDLDSPTQLSYKGAFFLLVQTHKSTHYYNSNLVDRTITFLEGEQEEDGGFGPWRGHPAGSDPWSTGVVLWGLSKIRSQVTKNTVKKALSWLRAKQLPNGLWPYHYLDDGTAMALIGISSSLQLLTEQ